MKTTTTSSAILRQCLFPALFAAFALSSCSSTPTQATETDNVQTETAATEMPAASAAPTMVSAKDQSLWNQLADTESSINSSNVKAMQLAWKYNTSTPVSHSPLVDETGVYFGDWSGTVYKLNPQNGQVVWKKTIEQPKKMWPWHGLAGTGTLGEDKLFEASVEGTAFAIDKNSGNVLWQTKITDDPEAGSLSTLLYHNGMVYVGLQSVEEALTAKMKDFKPDFQGKVMALNASNGQVAWERVLVEKPHNGCAVWSSFALDPELDMLYFTTGNNYTGEATDMSDAIVAVNAKTGEVKWHYQATQHDVWTKASKEGPDYDFAGGPQIFVASVNGQPRKLVGAGQKSGKYLVFDAQTGDKVWETVIGYGGVDGGMHGEASIGKDAVIAWSNNAYSHTMPPDKHKLSLKKLDAATGKHQWVMDKAQPAAIAPGYLVNDVYILGSLDGTIQAYSTTDGKVLASMMNPAPVLARMAVKGNSLYVSSGVAGIFGDWKDKGENGVYVYSTR
ncbi:outer membrane protein assembly factor BamB family protein [Pontibacter sp. MBLB2868]|uniref:outer membrane protein assembly factor BamB family protein n=1 Tax=Pontibacter sp. MBLB2868 TaxID=3451555 RepID=UPI003F7555A4